jgi:hypothetical protein
MKNLILASALGTLVGTFAVPAFHGPVHYQVTKPHSMMAWVPAGSGASPVTVTVGTVPMDFVLTDVSVGDNNATRLLVKVNGTAVLCMPGSTVGYSLIQTQLHLTTGLPILTGSSIVVESTTGSSVPTPVTLTGYLQ